MPVLPDIIVLDMQYHFCDGIALEKYQPFHMKTGKKAPTIMVLYKPGADIIEPDKHPNIKYVSSRKMI
jgi:hypothetical protein